MTRTPHGQSSKPFFDYYAFGSGMKERTGSFGATYKYGFNNQEKEGELGEYYSFEYRVHDARLGRFLSVDPLSAEYPWNSAYAFAENQVIWAKDLEGAERLIATITQDPVNKANTKVHVHVAEQGVAISLTINFADCAGNIINSRVGGANDFLSQQINSGCINTPLTNLGQNNYLKQYNYNGIVYRDNKNNPAPIAPDVTTGIIKLPFNSVVSDMHFNLSKNEADWKWEETRTNITRVTPHMERVWTGRRTPIVTINIPVVTINVARTALTPESIAAINNFPVTNPGVLNLNVVRNLTFAEAPGDAAYYNNFDRLQQIEYQRLGINYNCVTNYGQPASSKTVTTGGLRIFDIRQTGWNVTTVSETRTNTMNVDCSTSTGPTITGTSVTSEVPLATAPAVGPSPWVRNP